MDRRTGSRLAGEAIDPARSALMARIRDEKVLSDEIVGELKSAVEDFKSTWS